MGEFTKKDFALISEWILSEYDRRKNKRRDMEKVWKEVDRQIRMEPVAAIKTSPGHEKESRAAWIPELELPLQAQTLEILTADARRMRFPDTGPWYRPHSMVTDKYLDEIDLSAIISGDENDVPSIITQDNADKLVQGTLDHFHRQYDFFGNWDLISGEAFKYGTGVGRARIVQKTVFSDKAKGVVKQNQSIPVMFPVTVKNTYLDDRTHHLMNEGHIISPATIQRKTMQLKDLELAAKRGSNNVQSEAGGWIPKHIKGLEADKHGNVEVVEYEGDLVVPKAGKGSIHIPKALVTVVKGVRDGADDNTIIRFRIRRDSQSSYIVDPYHQEEIGSAYATSPLMKGWPIQKAAVELLSRSIAAGALSVEPPVSYDSDNYNLKSSGGPKIYPGAIWEGTGDFKPHQIGDPNGLFTVYIGLLQQYSDVTGVNAPRLGAQTVSHTTAYAKEAELSRGTIRTVDYVKSSLKDPMARWLDMEYKMGRDLLNNTDIFIDAYGGFVTVSKKHLPEKVTFEVDGAGGPAEEQTRIQRRLDAIREVISLDQIKMQAQMAGVQPSINFEEANKQLLKDGGWQDVDAIIGTEQPPQGVPQGAEAQPAMGGDSGVTTAPGAAIQALQGI